MKWRIFAIPAGAVVLVLAAGTGALYAYDSSRSDVIAKGVTAGGVDVGGLGVNAARDVLRRSLNGKISRAVVVEWRDRRWTLEARDVDAHLRERAGELRAPFAISAAVRSAPGSRRASPFRPRRSTASSTGSRSRSTSPRSAPRSIRTESR
jgi:hypothetical protein